MHWFLFVLIMSTGQIGVDSDPETGMPHRYAAEAECDTARQAAIERWGKLGKNEGEDFILACLQDERAEQESEPQHVKPTTHAPAPASVKDA